MVKGAMVAMEVQEEMVVKEEMELLVRKAGIIQVVAEVEMEGLEETVVREAMVEQAVVEETPGQEAPA